MSTAPPLFTYGYGFAAPAELARYVAALGATVADVRLVPWSKRPEWRGAALKAALGPRYGQVRALGNLNYRGPEHWTEATAATRTDVLLWQAYQVHGWLLADPARGLARLRPIWERGPVILLCGCMHVERCHRSLVAAYLARELGAPVTHLPGRFDLWKGVAA